MNSSIMRLIGLSPYPFIFISICYVFGVTLNIDQLEIISTLLLIPSLSLFYISNSKRNLAYELILVFSWTGSFLIMSDSFVYSIGGVIFFWGTILLISDHILKKLHKPMKEQLKKKETILLLVIHLAYLITVLLYLSEDLKVFIYPILFYAATLIGTSFLSSILWREQQSNKNLFLMIGTVLLVFSGSIYAIKLFTGTLSITQNFIRVTLFTCSVFLICLHFTASKKSK